LSQLLAAIHIHAKAEPKHVAIQGSREKELISYAELSVYIEYISCFLNELGASRVAIWMDNTPAVLMVDLACVQNKLLTVPVPLFFTPQQISHSLHQAGIDTLVSGMGDAQTQGLLKGLGVVYDKLSDLTLGDECLNVYRLATKGESIALPADEIQKVTYTSGSTGDPKGVCLTQKSIETVVLSLLKATEAQAADRHLCLLPYATLLENIAGMYVLLMVGGRVCLPGLANVGMQGATGLGISRFISALHDYSATTCIMIPQMLQALLTGIDGGAKKPACLRFIAVGGAPVSDVLIQRSAQLDLPVFEGYGLSESASVVALNTAQYHQTGSVGRVLPHMEVRIADDGEIYLKETLFSGYLSDGKVPVEAEYATGDIGHLDDNGFLYIEGRKKHIFITSFGRNVSPEWVEKELSIEAAIAQICVFGEAQPFNVAVIVMDDGFEVKKDIAKAVEKANLRLPDYAQVHRWIIAHEPFCIANGQWTGTGRPRRLVIYQAYQALLDALYKEKI